MIFTLIESLNLEDFKICISNNVELVNKQNRVGLTPLHFLLKLNYFSTLIFSFIDILLEYGADTNACDFSGETPLIAALIHQPREIVLHLLQYDIDTNICDIDGYTPLFYSVLHENHENVSKLLYKSMKPMSVKKTLNQIEFLKYSDNIVRKLYDMPLIEWEFQKQYLCGMFKYNYGIGSY